jgi:hypothetical protein
MCYEIRRAEAWPTVGPVEEPGTLTQGAPVFPGSSRLGIEPKTPGCVYITPGWLVQDRTTSPSGIGSPPRAGLGLLLQYLL